MSDPRYPSPDPQAQATAPEIDGADADTGDDRRDAGGFGSPHHGVDPKLLEILVCPVTKSVLRYDPSRAELISEAAGLAFPIRDGVPIMLVDEARRLDDTPPAVAGPASDPA